MSHAVLSEPIADTSELMEALRKLRELRNVSLEQIDDLAGLPRGYTGKVIGGSPSKKLGAISTFPILGALAVKMQLVHDAEAFERLSARTNERTNGCVRNHAAQASVILRFSRRKLAKMGAKGGRAVARKRTKKQRQRAARKAAFARAAGMTQEERSKSAAKAAKQRWSTPQITEITATDMAQKPVKANATHRARPHAHQEVPNPSAQLASHSRKSSKRRR